MNIKITAVHFSQPQMSPDYRDQVMECVADDANMYEITRDATGVYVRCPAWGKRVLWVPLSGVRGAAGDVVEESAVKPEAAQAVAKR